MNQHKSFHHGDLKSKMIEIGLDTINKKGFSQISLKEVTKSCGVSIPSAYRHFQNKEDYIEKLLLEIAQIFNDQITVSDDVIGSKNRLLSMGVNFVEFSKNFPYYYELLFQSPYSIPIKIVNKKINLENPQDGFNLFREEVLLFLEDYHIGGDPSIHILHLWAYVCGLSIIVKENSEIFSTEVQIKSLIQNMLDIYIIGGKNN